MSVDLLRQPAHLSPPDALNASQQAPTFIRSQTTWTFPWPLSLLTSSDDPDIWTTYENLLYSCLRTGDNASANTCLERLKSRFGEDNERVMGLIGVYHEAIAPNEASLESLMRSYNEAIEEKPENMVVRKRRIALQKSMGKTKDAIAGLIELLDIVPTDSEAWSELADLYFDQGLCSQASFCLEEVLLIMPNAWNVHAKLAEVLYVLANTSPQSDLALAKGLTRSMKSFCRSIELCDDYLRGFYGLKLTTNKLKSLGDLKQSAREATDDEFAPLPTSKIERLNELATKKLAEIIRKHSSGEAGWTGYDEAEVIAARALLDLDSQNTTR